MIKVVTYGTFDLFHEGHYRLLKRAKALGDYLIVGVTTESYDTTRGKLNVIDSLATRMENVRKTGFADEIIIEENQGQKFSDIKKYGIDIFAIGSDWRGAFDYLKDYCKVVYLERTKNVSSTMLREKNRHIQRIGIIGTGRIAHRFIPEARAVSGVSVQGVYNPHLESAKKFAAQEEMIAYPTLEDLYQVVEVVYIASPHATHYEYIMSALSHHKHVICEKPMTLSRREAEDAFRLAKENGCLLLEGIKTAYCPGFQKMLGIACSGRIGAIRNIEACFTKIEGENTRELTDLATGGSFTELGSYIVLPVLKVYGTEYRRLIFDSIKRDDGLDLFTRASFLYDNGMATVTCGLGVKSEGRLLIAGTRGYVLVEAPWWKTSYFEVHYEDPTGLERYSEVFLGEGLRYVVSDMLSRMDNRSDEKASGDFKLTRQESVALAGIMEAFQKQRER